MQVNIEQLIESILHDTELAAASTASLQALLADSVHAKNVHQMRLEYSTQAVNLTALGTQISGLMIYFLSVLHKDAEPGVVAAAMDAFTTSIRDGGRLWLQAQD